MSLSSAIPASSILQSLPAHCSSIPGPPHEVIPPLIPPLPQTALPLAGAFEASQDKHDRELAVGGDRIPELGLRTPLQDVHKKTELGERPELISTSQVIAFLRALKKTQEAPGMKDTSHDVPLLLRPLLWGISMFSVAPFYVLPDDFPGSLCAGLENEECTARTYQ
jgi:hypothetical protein